MDAAAAATAAYSSDREASRTGIPPADLSGIEEFAQLLAKAVRQCRTYPLSSPLCEEAIAACHAALSRVEREQVVFRVRPRELVVEDTPIGAGTIIEHELARRLHRAHVGSLGVQSGASRRDLTRLCAELSAQADRGHGRLSLAELLTERGVDRIVPSMARPPEVLEAGAPGTDRRELVRRDRERRAELPAPANVSHLYPPDRGWVRLDPSVPLASVSLTDLAIIVDDPGELALMLLRLTDGDPADATRPQDALAIKFSDVAMLFASLDPRLARLMLSRLASAVLALEPERRQDLLQRTILPGLLDGKADGAVLRDFSDGDLAEALCLLLDLETAAPEVLTTALDRLDLADERRQALVPLLDDRLRRRQSEAAAPARDSADRYARGLLRIDGARRADYADFAAFDLSMDDEAERAVAEVRVRIDATDIAAARLQCLSSLVRLEPNPDLVQTFLARAQPLLVDLVRSSRWADVARWLDTYRTIADGVRESRPDVAERIGAAVMALFTDDCAARLCELYDAGDNGRAIAGDLVRAAGPAIGETFVTLLEGESGSPIVRHLTQMMCDHAVLLAPVLAARLPDSRAAAARTIVRALGHAGATYERAIAAQLSHRDEQTVREALRALARIGSADAAGLVAAQMMEGSAQVRAAAEEALWHFPQERGNAQVRALLGRLEFVRGNPQAAIRLMERAARAGAAGLEPVLASLAPLRFRVWSPALVRVGLKARRLLAA